MSTRTRSQGFMLKGYQADFMGMLGNWQYISDESTTKGWVLSRIEEDSDFQSHFSDGIEGFISSS